MLIFISFRNIPYIPGGLRDSRPLWKDRNEGEKEPFGFSVVSIVEILPPLDPLIFMRGHTNEPLTPSGNSTLGPYQISNGI